MSTAPSVPAFYQILHRLLDEMEAPELYRNAAARHAVHYFLGLLNGLLDGKQLPRATAKAQAYHASTKGFEGEHYAEYRGIVRNLLDQPAALLDELKHSDPLRSYFYAVCGEWLE